MKGATESILNNVTHYLDAQGNRQVMSDNIATEINQTIQSFATDALRTVALAYKDLKPDEGGKHHDEKAE